MSRTKKISDSRVLEMAFDVISKEGFQSFTFEQVGKVVGLSPATLVKRFKNKKRLALLARNQKWEHNIGQIESNKFKQLYALQGIFDFLKMIAASVNSKRLGEHAIWLGMEACHPSSKRKVAGYFEVTRGVFTRLLSEAILEKELSAEIEPKAFSKTLEALVQGSIFQFAFLYEGSIETHLISHFRNILAPYMKQK